jgi:hypothetical protein
MGVPSRRPVATESATAASLVANPGSAWAAARSRPQPQQMMQLVIVLWPPGAGHGSVVLSQELLMERSAQDAGLALLPPNRRAVITFHGILAGHSGGGAGQVLRCQSAGAARRAAVTR